MSNTKEQKRNRRHVRIRRAIETKDKQQRLCVHRSNRFITGQLVDDETGSTVASSTSRGQSGATYTERAHQAGLALAKAAVKKGNSAVVFDRGGYLYTGRVKAFAEGAREGGLVF